MQGTYHYVCQALNPKDLQTVSAAKTGLKISLGKQKEGLVSL